MLSKHLQAAAGNVPAGGGGYELYLWGDNAWGQVGNGQAGNETNPKQVGTSTDWASVSGGSNFTLAVKTGGTLWAWGLGSSGQLGDGTTVTKSSPVQIGALS